MANTVDEIGDRSHIDPPSSEAIPFNGAIRVREASCTLLKTAADFDLICADASDVSTTRGMDSMQAKDIMTTTVATIGPDATIAEIATLLLDRRISAVPVVDADGRMIGIVSEGDLIHRPETATERHTSWWLRLMASPQEKALAYVKSHGGHARDVMTRDIISVTEDTSLEEIADTLSKRRIKRVPVLRDGRIVGIVSRADLLHGLVARQASPSVSASDEKIKAMVEAAIADTSVRDWMVSVVVAGGVVHLWGAVESDEEKQAARVAAEGVPGVKGVRDGMNVLPPSMRALMGAE